MSEMKEATSAESKPAESSGPANSGPAKSGPVVVHSTTPENREGELNPSAPGDAGTTPGTTGPK